jgi:hypothetical protein
MHRGNIARNKTVVSRLEAQLKKGTKPSPEGDVPLTDKDITRINKELGIVQTRLMEGSKAK